MVSTEADHSKRWHWWFRQGYKKSLILALLCPFQSFLPPPTDPVRRRWEQMEKFISKLVRTFMNHENGVAERVLRVLLRSFHPGLFSQKA